MSLSLATAKGSVPLAYRLYLPQEWAQDKPRRALAGVPKEIAFATQGELAWTQIEAALAAGIPRGTVLVDAGYGDEAGLRDRLSAHGLPYAVGIRPATAVWWEQHQPAPTPVKPVRGRRRTRVLRDETHQPIGVLELAQRLPRSRYRTITWREGTNAPLRSRFARVRVRAAHADRPREEEWLLIEWPKGEAQPTPPHPLFPVHPAGGHLVQGTGSDRQNALAHRARLPGTQAGSRSWSLRRTQLARLSSSCELVHRCLWISHAGAPLRQ